MDAEHVRERLPLPADPLLQAYAATWWLDLVGRFLSPLVFIFRPWEH